MGSVLGEEPCPKCRGEAQTEFYYNTGEDYIFCPSCGYIKECKYQRDASGRLVTKDGTTDYSFDNLIWTVTEKRPYACYRVKMKASRVTQIGVLDDADQAEEFRRFIFIKVADVESASISRYDEQLEEVTWEEVA
jgi:hypothetical protein